MFIRGRLLGQRLTGDIGLVAIILGIVGAVILFGAAFRRGGKVRLWHLADIDPTLSNDCFD